MKKMLTVLLCLSMFTISSIGFIGCSSGSSDTYATCQFKRNGVKVCSNKATRGQLCEYHFKMLDDTYNDLIG